MNQSPNPHGILSMRHLVKYPDCNATQNLFGGQMLAWIDEAAALYASCQMHSDHIVTRLVGAIEFRVPVPLGYVCSIYTDTQRVGNTSLTVAATVTRRAAASNVEDVVCQTHVVFVAIDHLGKPTPWS